MDNRILFPAKVLNVDDPLMIAQLSEVARGRLYNQVSRAEFLK